MENIFEYTVSVIVPVYNAEEYLRDCLESLVMQTMDHDKMEVLLINDGSTDESLEICQEYAEIFPMFKVFSKNNEGLSATRNYGVKRARGKYMIYLDADDKFTPETIKNVTVFFESHYDEVDLVTFPIAKYYDGWKKREFNHFRYKYLLESGVYDLLNFPYITQTTINICTKNVIPNIMFDTTEKFHHEDQKYNNDILKDKLKIGYCKNAEYMYLQHSGSIMHTYDNAPELWESTMNYYEKMFGQYTDKVPSYYQGMFIHDCNWKMRDNILFPYHYSDIEFRNAMRRLSALFERVDTEVILGHPTVDKFHKYFFLTLCNRNITLMATKQRICLMEQKKCILSETQIEVILRRIKVNNNVLKMVGSIKSPLFSFMDKPMLQVKHSDGKTEPIDLFLSGSSWYKSRSQTNVFWSFVYELDILKIEKDDFILEVIIDGITFSTRFWVATSCAFCSTTGYEYCIYKNIGVKLSKNRIYIKKLNSFEKQTYCQKNTLIAEKKDKEVATQRKMFINQNSTEKEIWLYYDNLTVLYDNAYLQFIHDFEMKDGIDRYYIYDRPIEEIYFLFEEKHNGHLIRFGDMKHKMLYINATKILTSFIEHFSLTPFKSKQDPFFLDVYNAEVIYLQHGVLHAHIPWFYTPEMVEADKVVISSYFEIDNFTKTYGYKENDLVKTGMARYDKIDIHKKPSNRILFAPSWRDYLIGKFNDSGERRETYDEKLLMSNYYKGIIEFISSKRMLDFLEEQNMYLDVKLHPNFYTSYRHLIDFNYNRVILAENKVDVAEYKMFITDFSSFVFDYAYLKRPIMYFVPDYIEFLAGMNRYRELDLPYEKAFGNLTVDVESAIDEVIRNAKNNFVPDTVFKERMERFYFPMKNCCKNLYNYLMKNGER